MQFFLHMTFQLNLSNVFYHEHWDVKLAECKQWLVDGCQEPMYKRNRNDGKLVIFLIGSSMVSAVSPESLFVYLRIALVGHILSSL